MSHRRMHQHRVSRAPWHASHYDVLGVRPSADAAQIRKAYVRQLKRSHPDSAGQQTTASGWDVQTLVTAYKTLKDDAKRAAYDAQLSRQTERQLSKLPQPRMRKVKRYRFHPGAIAYQLGCAILFATILLTYRSFDGTSGAANAQQPRTAYVAADGDDVPSPARLEPVAELAGRLSVADAAAFSSRCFEDARRARALSAADSCVAFDTAFVYWRQGVVGTDVTEAYFQPQAVKSRIEHAFPRLDDDAAMVRGASVRASTFEALLRVVDSRTDLASSNTVPNQDSSDVMSQGDLQDETNMETP